MSSLNGLQRIYETCMIIFAAFAVFLFVSLMSFHQADPGWTQTGLQVDTRNLMGSAGAYVADMAFFLLGYLAYLLPFACLFIGYFSFQQVKQVMELDFLTIALRLLGIVFLLIGASGLGSLNFDDMYYFNAGGIIGEVIKTALIPYFNLLGTSLLLLSFFLVGVTLSLGLSWVVVVDKIGQYTIDGLLWLKSKVSLHQSPAADKSVAFTPINNDHSITVTQETIYAADASACDNVIDPSSINKVTEAIACEDISVPDEPKVSAVNSPLIKTKTITPLDPTLPPLPSFDLLDRPNRKENPISEAELESLARLVEAKLADFNIEAKVVGVYPGPVITRFELDLAPGVKVSKITTLAKDLARAMSAMSVRVVEVIPGKSVIGLELPNKHREMVSLSEVIASETFAKSDSNLTMVLGGDIAGKPVVVDLAKMPHLLVAGTTGSGKSVGVNVMILSLLYKSRPEDVRMIMIDPKMLELSVYEGIPHLLAEVVTDMKLASNALRWCVGEMERRYKLMSALGVRNLKGYNAKIAAAKLAGETISDPLWNPGDSMDSEAPALSKLPSIVVVVDEFADMMMIVGKKVEELIARIAQKARAAGIHLILATQRPSVDVITGLIKANIPTRIAFQVSSKIDSRTVLDQQGAETLLGMGDMLYLPPGTGVPMRVHGAFVDDHEVHAVVADWKKRGQPEYIDAILSGEDETGETLLPGEASDSEEELDAFYDEAVAFVTQTRKVSVSSVQRKFRIGYNRAARLVEQMEAQGVVSSPGHNGGREVLAPPPVAN